MSTSTQYKNRVFNYVQLSLIIGLAFFHGAQALTEFQVLEVVAGFAQNYLAPYNVEVARSINSTLFAEDVTGTADLSTNFDGRELSTEYLFGLFTNIAEDPTDPSPFGSPLSYNVTALLVQHQFVSTSIKFQFHYPVLNQTFPIQIDAFMQVNDKQEIQQYDVSFRRWAWATDVIIPQLIPHMAARVNMTNSADSTAILRSYLSSKLYYSYQPLMGEDNLVCRHLHVPMVALRPSVHCPHIGPSGGDMCIARDYDQVVLDSHFLQGWLAPKYVTPENQDEVGGIQAVSGQELSPLLEIALGAVSTHSWDPTLYATALLGYFLFFYVFSNLLWFIYFRRSSVFPTCGLEHQKNIVMYTMNIIFTTIALALELVASPAFAGRYGLWEIQCLRTAGVLTSALYIFELVYRLKMRIPMIAHHFLTIIAISFTVTVFEYTQSMSYLLSAIIWLFQATTEQPTFLGLLLYRLDWDPRIVSKILKFAAIQTFVLKSASAIALIVYWGLHQNYSYQSIDIAWTCMVFIIAVGLLLTQIWGSWVTYKIGDRIMKKPPILSNPNMKGSNLAIYQTIRLKPEYENGNENGKQRHNRNDSVFSTDSNSQQLDDVYGDRFEVLTTDESDSVVNSNNVNNNNINNSVDQTKNNNNNGNSSIGNNNQDYNSNYHYPYKNGNGDNSQNSKLTKLPSFSSLYEAENNHNNGYEIERKSLMSDSDFDLVNEKIDREISSNSFSALLKSHQIKSHINNGSNKNNDIINSHDSNTTSNNATYNSGSSGYYSNYNDLSALSANPTNVPLPKSPAIMSPTTTSATSGHNNGSQGFSEFGKR